MTCRLLVIKLGVNFKDRPPNCLNKMYTNSLLRADSLE